MVSAAFLRQEWDDTTLRCGTFLIYDLSPLPPELFPTSTAGNNRKLQPRNATPKAFLARLKLALAPKNPHLVPNACVLRNDRLILHNPSINQGKFSAALCELLRTFPGLGLKKVEPCRRTFARNRNPVRNLLTFPAHPMCERLAFTPHCAGG
jgi:hypothetical protein